MKNIKNITQLAIKDLKSEADLKTDYALAKALNVSQSSIARYSNGTNSITLEKLESMANDLNKKVIIKYENKQ